MRDISWMDKSYNKHLHDPHFRSSENWVEVDMAFLEQLGLAHSYNSPDANYELNYAFHFDETEEKITLWNERFVIWIIPEAKGEELFTHLIVGLNTLEEIKVEIAFTASGVYNNSQLILRILEKLLMEIEETESLLQGYRVDQKAVE